MTDDDDYYWTNEEIKQFVFKGETFPGDNTVSTDQNVVYKELCDSAINSGRWTTNYTGNRLFDVKIIWMRLYQDFLEGKTTSLTDTEQKRLDSIAGKKVFKRHDPYDA